MNLKKAIAGLAVAAAAAGVFGTSGCSVTDGYGYQPAYVTARIQCPNNPFLDCVVMSDGDVVQVAPSLWYNIMYGMVLVPNAYGGYHFTRSTYSVHRITTTTSYSQYKSVTPVSVGTEVTQQKYGTTYNAGGSRYTSSPVYKANLYSGKSTYSSVKNTYNPAKQNYSTVKVTGGTGYKSSFSSGKYGH